MSYITQKERRSQNGLSGLDVLCAKEFILVLQPNHLLGHRKMFLQLNFRNISDLLTVRRDLLPLALANGKKMDAVDAYAEVINAEAALRVQIDGEESVAWGDETDKAGSKAYKDKDPRENIIDIREYDVPYYLRVAIDNGK